MLCRCLAANRSRTDIAKSVRLVFAPLQCGAVLQDRFRHFIEKSAARVLEDDRVIPAPQILGPVLEAIRYEPEGSISEEAFSRLLSRAFDREKLGQAHPAFPGLLRTLCDDELGLLKQSALQTIEVPCARVSGDKSATLSKPVFALAVPSLTYPENLLVYCEHLESHGLIRPLIAISTEASAVDSEGYSLLFWPLRLSNFGTIFVRAVLV